MLFTEALKREYDEPKPREIREINDIMNNSITGWRAFLNPRHFDGYGRQKGWGAFLVTTNCRQRVFRTPKMPLAPCRKMVIFLSINTSVDG